MKLGLILILILLLTACGAPGLSTPAPTPEPINITYPSALQPWADKLADCASNNPLVALYFNSTDLNNTDLQANEIMLALGQVDPSLIDLYLSQVGWEQVVVVVNKENQISQLSADELRAIFSGQVSTWENAVNQPIQVWVLPNGEPTRIIFDRTVMLNQSITSEARLAPDPYAVLEAISQDVNSIGYLPESYLNMVDATLAEKVKTVQLEPTTVQNLLQVVIATTQSEPKGLIRNLLVCLQTITP